MLLQYFVTENKTGACIPVEITPATQSDLLVTKSGWQSDWTSDFIRDSQLEKRVAKAASGEIIALGAYREDQNGISIFIVNMEAHPQSNPMSAVNSYQWYAPAWLNMYRRKFLLDNELYFKKGIYFEDVQMLPRVFLPAKKITCINGTFYHYIIRENSIMTSQRDGKKKNDSVKN